MDFWYLIVNRTAGGGSCGRLWPRIEKELQRLDFSYTVKFTEGKMHAARLAEDAVLKGYRKIMAVGGDGTLHEVANGILSQDFAPSNSISLALLPIGTGNDWAKMWNLPIGSPAECLQKIKAERTVFQDAGLVRFQENGAEAERFFINVAGMAYDAFVCRYAKDEKILASSPMRYYALIIKCLWKYVLSPSRLIFEENGLEKTVEDSFYTINVGLCKFSGGGMQFVPQAVADDGLFALTFAKKLSKAAVILATPLFFNGKIASHPKVTCTQARSVRVENLVGQPPVLLEADGEFLGESPVEFILLEKALKIVV